MKRIPRPTDHYDKQLLQIDEQICSLLQQRKALSNNNPGLPPDDVLSNWAVEYELYPEFLYQMFGAMRYENLFKSRIEPNGFRKQLAVLKSIEIDERFYSVTVIRQYENASLIQLHIDWEESDDTPIDLNRNDNTFELFVGEEYDCRNDRSGGSTGHYTYNFIVSPPLPDDISGQELEFIEYSNTLKEEPTGLEIKIPL